MIWIQKGSDDPDKRHEPTIWIRQEEEIRLQKQRRDRIFPRFQYIKNKPATHKFKKTETDDHICGGKDQGRGEGLITISNFR